jgi:hypothetical protein
VRIERKCVTSKYSGKTKRGEGEKGFKIKINEEDVLKVKRADV